MLFWLETVLTICDINKELQLVKTLFLTPIIKSSSFTLFTSPAVFLGRVWINIEPAGGDRTKLDKKAVRMKMLAVFLPICTNNINCNNCLLCIYFYRRQAMSSYSQPLTLGHGHLELISQDDLDIQLA